MENVKESIREVKRWEDYETIKCPDGQIIDMQKLLDDQERAKVALAHLEPFLGSMINRIRFVYTFRIQTQATDGYNIFVNPQFTANLTFEGKVFVLAHEIWHCILDHMRRGRKAGHDPRKSNIAADYEVNSTISLLDFVKDDVQHKIGSLLDHKYDKMAYEQIYAMNPPDKTQGGKQNNQSNAKGQSGQGQSGQGQSNSGSDDSSSSNSNNGNKQDSQGRGNGKQGEVRPEDCRGQFGNDQPDVPGTFTDRNEGKKLAESEGYSDSQGGDENLAKEWKEAAIKNKNKLRGDKDGSIASKIDAVWNTTTDWKKALRDIIGRSLNTDDKRQAFANKNVLISQDRIARIDKDRYDAMDYMIAFIDSSGSMSDHQLQIVLGEIYNIAIKKKPIKFVVVQCDTKIQEIKEYYKPDDIKRDFKTATVKGRGGTELKPCWDLLLKDKKYSKRPAELAIVFTDGYLTQYKRNPKTMSNLVWVILDNPGFRLEYPDPKTKVIYLKTEDVD